MPDSPQSPSPSTTTPATRRSLSYAVQHLEIDGMPIDRERGYPELSLELTPTGLALPREKQEYELTLRIGSRGTTKLDAAGIKILYDWLTEHTG